MPKQTVIAIAAALLVQGAPASADYVVLQSESELFGIGALLADDTELRLEDGERVVLLSESGEVVEVKGPYEGLPEGNTAPDIDVRDALTNLIENADELHASLGSTRSADLNAGSGNRDPWQLDAFRSGRQCVVADRAIELWREATKDAITLEMQRPGVDGSADISWAVGVAEAPWPDSVPVTNDSLYVLRRPGWTEAALIHVMVLDRDIVRHIQAAIAWLAAHGCGPQAELLMSEFD